MCLRIRTRESEQQLSELEDDSTDIYKSNIIERYSFKPNRSYMNGVFGQGDNLCLAEFAANYYKGLFIIYWGYGTGVSGYGTRTFFNASEYGTQRFFVF